MRSLAALLLTASLTACMVGSEPGDQGDPATGKADLAGGCKDAAYGDGVCHASLSCGVSDVDCFSVPASDADAATLMGEMGLATVKVGDPRVTRARRLVDRAWELFQTYYPVGSLADKHLGAVVIQNETPNAFVIPDPTVDSPKAMFAVFVHSGLLLSSYTDDQILGVLLHELGHMYKLHALPEVAAATTRWYHATNVEPIGAVTGEQATARAAGDRWVTLAEAAGSNTAVELGGLPIGGTYGRLFDALLVRLVESPNTTCKANTRAAAQLWIDIANDTELDESVTIYATTQADAEQIFTLLGACKASAPTLTSLAEQLDPLTRINLQIQLMQSNEAPLLGTNAIDALQTLVGSRRASLRALTAELAAKGKPVHKLRHYTVEEQADDVSVRVTKRAGLTTVGSSGFGQAMLGTQAAACDAARAINTVPYGIHLEDPHHGLCWRIAHMHQYARTLGARMETEDVALATGPFEVTVKPRFEPLY